jgi:hypothetical protein
MNTTQFDPGVERLSGGFQSSWASQRVSRLVRRGSDGTHLRCAIVVGAALLVAAAIAWISGCTPEEAAGESTLQPAPRALAQPEPVEPREPKPASATAATELEPPPSYELPFEARANPFQPPSGDVRPAVPNATPVRPAEVKLFGLMKNEKGLVAAIEVCGKLSLVVTGARLALADGAGELYVREIRESEIIVEQGGRRRAILLPRPEAVHADRPASARESLPALNGR